MIFKKIFELFACLLLIFYLSVLVFPLFDVFEYYSLVKLTFHQAQICRTQWVKPNVCVVGYFKNEAHILREWIEHYQWQGFDHILLLDNGSTDEWSIKGFQNVTAVSAPIKHGQELQYNTIALPWLKQNSFSFAAILDLDEFIFSNDGRCVKDLVLDLFALDESVGQIFVQWSMFGSSGFYDQPASVRESFTLRLNGSFYGSGKSIVSVDRTEAFKVHRHVVQGTTIETTSLQLNHYPIQSQSFFERIKMTRGAADTPEHESVRDKVYFEKYDFKDYEDFALRDLVVNDRKRRG